MARQTMLGLVAFASILGGCGDSPGPPPPASTMLVALDGADWRNVVPLLRQGKLPVIGALRRSGASATMLTNADHRWSPVLWTTVATGRLPESHGVQRFFAIVDGIERPIPTPSISRRCKALWNIFSEADLTTGFVGWWVTWPAEPVNGFMVSDHFSVSRFDLGEEFDRDVKDRAYHERQTYPEGLVKDISHLRYPRQRVGREDLARFAELPEDFEFPEKFVKFDKPSEFAIAHSVDRTHFNVGYRLLLERRPTLFGVFFQGVDIMQHFFWEAMDPEGTGTQPGAAHREMWGQSVEKYYGYADGLIGALVRAGGDRRTVMIVSDHGFRPSRERFEEKGITGEHRRQAVFLLAGPGVRRHILAADVDAVDVAPTVLAYHGLPTARDLDGEPAIACFTDAWLAGRPLRTIDTYETGDWERPELPETSVSRDLEERIRAIGYID